MPQILPRRGPRSMTHPSGGRPGFGHSHSMVAGGFELMSYTTRLTPGTSLTMRYEILPRTSYGSLAQSAVIPSSDVTARMATTLAYVRPSPMTPTDRTGVRIANDCQTLRYS